MLERGATVECRAPFAVGIFIDSLSNKGGEALQFRLAK